MNESLINVSIYGTYVLVGLAVLAIVVFSVAQIVKNPTGARNALIGIAILGGILFITYSISDSGDLHLYSDKIDVSEGTSQLVGMGLYSFYVLSGLTILSILYVEVSRLFK